MASIDLTVRGAGIFGLSVAWAALQKGARVRVVDPHGVGAGSSGGVVGALAPHTPDNWNTKKAFQFDSLIMAEAFWREVDQVSGLSSGYARRGRLQSLPDARAVELAYERIESAKHLWQGAAVWEVLKADDLGPWAPVTPTGLIARDTLAAHMNPAGACASLAAAITARGGEIVSDAPDQGAVLWATGVAGLQDLSAGFGRDMGIGIKGQAAVLGYDARGLPQVFADAVHVVPHENGTVAVGSTSEREFDNPASVDDQLDDVIATARASVPALAEAPVLARWAGVRPRSRTRSPILGPWPGRDGHFVANGGFKIGFGMAPKVAEVMAALILDGDNRIPDEFRIEAV